MRVVLAKGALRGTMSGASETVVTYATHLRQSGHDVSVFLMYPSRRSNPYWRRLRRSGVPVVSAAPVDAEAALLAGGAAMPTLRRMPAAARPISAAGKSLLQALAARYAQTCQGYLRRSGADLLHVVGQDSSAKVLISAAHAVGIPCLFHELGGGTRPSVFTGLTAALPRCAEVAVLSPGIAQRIGDVLPARTPVSVVPIMTEPPEGARRARPSRPHVVFGSAGRLDLAKGSLVMVEAFARARAAVPDITLRVVGTGPVERRLLARAQALGVADACEHPKTYAEPVERTSFMSGIDVLLLSSATEGTPNCIVEAMAHGVPVISTSVGGIPDVVTAEVGALLAPDAADALAQAMICLAGDPLRRARMGLAAVERYERLFSPSAVMPLLLETYRRVAGVRTMPATTVNHDWAACGERW